ncbi:hypothetical protein PS3A_44250 [Pseudomonas sp. 3A(2025)]
MMATGLFVPVKRIPVFSELLDGIALFLSRFFVTTGGITVGVNLAGGLDLSKGLIIVQDHEQSQFCRVSFSEVSIESREISEYDLPIVAQVITRPESSFYFSVAVSYAIGMSLGGRVVYDDGHIYFDAKKDVYSLLEVEQYLMAKV